MCSYCGCRAIRPIGDLTLEHVTIQNLIGEVRRAVIAGDHTTAAERLFRLVDVLHEHDAVEEQSIYPAMARLEEYDDKVGTLFDEHDDVDAALGQALATIAASGPAAVRWPEVLARFEELVEHIQHEENGLFPAAAIALDTSDWEHAERVREDYRRAHPDVPDPTAPVRR